MSNSLINECRKSFEEWAIHDKGLLWRGSVNGKYFTDVWNNAWAFWQAGWKSREGIAETAEEKHREDGANIALKLIAAVDEYLTGNESISRLAGEADKARAAIQNMND